MADMDTCPDCGHQLSRTAKQCPGCGRVGGEQREHLYTALVNVRNAELTVYWTRYNIQSVLNTGFLVVVLNSLTGPKPSSSDPVFWTPLMGITLALVWFGFAVVGKRLFVEGWEEWIAEYEDNWLRLHYGEISKVVSPAPRGPLLFYGLKARDARSPIHPDPVGERRKRAGLGNPVLRKPQHWLDNILPDWLAWSNLNFLSRFLPILFFLAWILIAWWFWGAGTGAGAPFVPGADC